MAGARGGTHQTSNGKGQITGGGGAAGAPPPPGAPIEVAQPVSDAWTREAARLARANERDLPPFNPNAGGEVSEAAVRAREVDALMGGHGRKRPPVQPSAPASSIIAAEPTHKSIIITDADAPDTQQSAADAPAPLAPAAPDASAPPPPAPAPAPAPEAPPVIERPAPGSKLAQAARDRLAHRERVAQPAASATDSPARGIPTRASDPGKQITGGFGDAIEQQYFPLDGRELKEVVLGLMDKLAVQLENDLRFGMAMVYPRVSATVVVRIDCYAQEMSFEIPKRAVTHKTTVEVAEAAGAVPTSINLEANVAEFSPDGESLMPPNRMRKELGLEVPRKQRVATPTGYAVVDVVSK
jgi:hypothetical protein